jgi:hypothetical protein
MKIQEITLQKAITLLKSLNCQYAIIDANGITHGDLPVAGNNFKTRSKSLFAHGELANYVKNYLKNLSLGQVVEIPCEQYPIVAIQTSACNWMRTHVGSDTYTTHANKETNCVEVLRIA